MHPGVLDFLRRCRARIGQPASVLEIGSYNVNGSAREVFATRRYVGIDLRPGPGVDQVADGATFWCPSQLIICCETLEHAPNARGILDNIRDNCSCCPESPAHVIITAATDRRMPHSGQDGGQPRAGEYYRNIDVAALASWLFPFGRWTIDVDRDAGDVYVLAER